MGRRFLRELIVEKLVDKYFVDSILTRCFDRPNKFDIILPVNNQIVLITHKKLRIVSNNDRNLYYARTARHADFSNYQTNEMFEDVTVEFPGCVGESSRKAV